MGGSHTSSDGNEKDIKASRFNQASGIFHHNDPGGELKKWGTSSKKQHFCQQRGE
jgi:hypothetical protein